jgi:hypothetical protein
MAKGRLPGADQIRKMASMAAGGKPEVEKESPPSGAAPAASKGTNPPFSVRIDVELADKVRAVAFWKRMKMVDLVEAALTNYIEKLEAEDGRPFPVPPRGN